MIAFVFIDPGFSTSTKVTSHGIIENAKTEAAKQNIEVSVINVETFNKETTVIEEPKKTKKKGKKK